MHPCSIKVDPPNLHLPRQRARLVSSVADLHLLIVSLGAVTFIVILLGFFVYDLKSSTKVLSVNFSETKSPPPVDKGTTLVENSGHAERHDSTRGGFPSKSSSSSSGFKAKSISSEQSSVALSAAVYTDHGACSDIGRSILLRGGNAMDAAIAAFLCLSAALPHRGGLGGGLIATIHTDSRCTTLNARESCPADATEAFFINRRDETVVGPRAVAVPAALNGLYRAFEKYSSKRLSWRRLVKPTIELCLRGITVTKELSQDLLEFQSLIMNNSRMRSHFVNETTAKVLAVGEKMLCPLLANFLRDMMDADDPVEFFYRGQGSKRLLKFIGEGDGFIAPQDLEDCESEFQPGVQMFLGGHVICGPPPPSIYSIVQLAVAVMYESNSSSTDIPLLAWDKSKLIGDAVFDETILDDAEQLIGKDSVQDVLKRFRNRNSPEIQYEPEEKGSFSVLVIDEKGNAVSMTSSLGDKCVPIESRSFFFLKVFRFGNREFTEFGFFMNNAMGAFTYGAQMGSMASRNAPQPAKCPRTQMSPVIGIKDGEVSFASGGTDYLGTCTSLLGALTSSESLQSRRTPLLFKNEDGLHSLSSDKSLLAGY
ncbi:gamma-glutamyltranspeptidase [Ancylostoma caninum]|uniref:Gamma-glutamyltranspeptidase n=1 Tax=Ancylostoma caninum TaxID=29170 RepID=A0A368HC21_ANCCA|nr:gamma-glutamyltranspeptidase [Ancylostoma caninum]